MSVKIRLQRHGKKGQPFYHIVIADSRFPRDGRYIEKLGWYNTETQPASIELNFEKALSWLQKGAVPSDTCKTILAAKGVIYKNHLLKGVRKGKLDEATAQMKFETWLSEKENTIHSEKQKTLKKKEDEKKKMFLAESKVKEARAEELAKRRSEMAAQIEKEKAEATAAEQAKQEEIIAAATPPVEEKVIAPEVTAVKEEPVAEPEQNNMDSPEQPAEETNNPA